MTMISIPPLTDSQVLILVIFVASVIGSFSNVVLHRTTANFKKGVRETVESLWEASRCTTCQTKIPIYLNIPVVSWLLLRGRSSCCKNKINCRYIIIEAATIAVAVLAHLYDWRTILVIPLSLAAYLFIMKYNKYQAK